MLEPLFFHMLVVLSRFKAKNRKFEPGLLCVFLGRIHPLTISGSAPAVKVCP